MDPEILAPAGDMESLKAALKGGADAVYLGVKQLNARQGATNFDTDELEEAIDLAHIHGVKVFLALNIPLKQKELQQALEVVDLAYAAGIDAIILQDPGLISILHTFYPDLHLHASTQMTIHNTPGVELLADWGASRAIVSRELTTTELKEIIKTSPIEIEVFVHGALCYSYSGNCLFSSFTTGRSANRGACAQLCRMPYHFTVNGKKVFNKGRFPISCAELSTLERIDEIKDTGVTSLKIEGRMKRPEYVTGVTMEYKRALKKEPHQIELARLFYRGFTQGFILGERDVVHSRYSSDYGQFLGKVEKITRNGQLTIKLEHDVHVKDGVGIHTKNRVLGSSIININPDPDKGLKGQTVTLEISPKTAKAVKKGDEVYLTTDRYLLKQLQDLPMQSYPVDIEVIAQKDHPLKMHIHNASLHASITDEYVVQAAKSSPTTEDKILQAVQKLGDTSLSAASVSIKADEDIFIPLKVISNLKRQVAEAFTQQLITKREPLHPVLPGIPPSPAKSQKLSVEVADIPSYRNALAAGADIIYLPIELFPQVRDSKADIFFITPRVAHDHEIDLPLLEEVRAAGFGITCSDFGMVRIANKLHIPFVARKELNIFNSYSVFQLGATRVTLSPELNLEEMQEIEGPGLEAVVYGRELMLITEHDLIEGMKGIVHLVNKKGDMFPVKRWGTRTLIYDSKVLNMLDNLHKLSFLDVVCLDLSLNRSDEITHIVTSFKNAIQQLPYSPLKGRAFTTGHYFKGV